MGLPGAVQRRTSTGYLLYSTQVHLFQDVQVLCTFVLETTMCTSICTFETFSNKHCTIICIFNTCQLSIQKRVLLKLSKSNHYNHMCTFRTLKQSLQSQVLLTTVLSNHTNHRELTYLLTIIIIICNLLVVLALA